MIHFLLLAIISAEPAHSQVAKSELDMISDMLGDVESKKDNLLPNYVVTKMENVLDRVFSSNPTNFYSTQPSLKPTLERSIYPSEFPSMAPSNTFTSFPSNIFSGSPSFLPSESPSLVPTNFPSKSPSTLPSSYPTQFPSTKTPSAIPTEIASLSPTNNPSSSPSISAFPTYRKSRNYWNYNPSSKYGPKRWERAQGDKLFMKTIGSTTNRCDSNNKQSPIILKPNSECADDHQIHTEV